MLHAEQHAGLVRNVGGDADVFDRAPALALPVVGHVHTPKPAVAEDAIDNILVFAHMCLLVAHTLLGVRVLCIGAHAFATGSRACATMCAAHI
jgi:hypothetical protein